MAINQERRRRWAAGAILFGLTLPAGLTVSFGLTLTAAQAQTQPDIAGMFARAIQSEQTGVARKTKSVDARPARPGEVVITIIKGEGQETQSRPAERGDMVVRNRCPATGNEEILVKAVTFAERYEGPVGATDSDGWSPYRPRGIDMLYFIVRPQDGTFTFQAPWGEPMIARPGDAIVRDPGNPKDAYRIARAAFDCTYEITQAPKPKRSE
jgi:hypothetical protein